MGSTTEIEVRLFGLGRKAAEIETVKRKVIEEETLLDLWQNLKAEAEPGSVMANAAVESVLAILNGKPCHGKETLHGLLLSDGDKVTFMLMVCGG